MQIMLVLGNNHRHVFVWRRKSRPVFFCAGCPGIESPEIVGCTARGGNPSPPCPPWYGRMDRIKDNQSMFVGLSLCRSRSCPQHCFHAS